MIIASLFSLAFLGLEEFKQPEVNEYGPRDSSVKPTTGCDKESDNSKENTDDSLKQQQKTDSSSVKSPLKVDKDWKEKFFCPANQVREEEPKKARENNDALIIEDWVSDDEDEVEPIPKVEKKTVIPTATKKEFVKPETPVRRSVSCPNVHKHMVPRAVLMKTDLKTINTVSCKATSEESMLWHRRLGHVNFKNINKLVKENLVRDLPFKRFENDQTCVACLKGKQHRASCKTKAFSPITKPLFMLHMDLFGPTFVSSLMHKKYCLVVTDDYSRFSWVFFLTTKDETSEILKNFIKEVENLVDKKVKIIRSDNGTEFKNKVMDEFCREKGIKREYSVARTPQQNGVAERKNRTLIEAARTMLADSKLPTTFWAEAVSTACYVHNRVLIVKPHNKTPYELFRGIKPAIGFMKPFGCHVTILNTLDKLGKFDGKSDEGFFVGYSLSSKAFRVYNIRTRKVQENCYWVLREYAYDRRKCPKCWSYLSLAHLLPTRSRLDANVKLEGCFIFCHLSDKKDENTSYRRTKKKFLKALRDPAWEGAMQIQEVEMVIVIRNKSKTFAQGHNSRRGHDNDGVPTLCG
ncbi:putative ribonuclease H-like domain-containing protein [Tanacetum coccineum]|uniref:Ribonuclease H-like domain-containing protein n=1 Tax=Tanacetum coccineum TaxID=301880 RepID=A0ABQ5FF11_9ASTR